MQTYNEWKAEVERYNGKCKYWENRLGEIVMYSKALNTEGHFVGHWDHQKADLGSGWMHIPTRFIRP